MIPWLLLGLWACGSGDAPSGTTGSVECRGMSHQNLVWRTARSALLSYDEQTGVSTPRCQFLLSSVLTGNDVQLDVANALQLDEVPDSGSGWIHADRRNWIIDSGTLSFDQFDDTLAIGTYVIDVNEVDETNTRTSTFATFEGEFSWCEGVREDCPFRFDSKLTKSGTLDTPVMLEHPVELTECRMIVDPVTEALQVDLQIGTYRNANVGQLWTNECGVFGQIPPQNNLFRFQAGGVSGPGSYGPQTSAVFAGGQRLPNLDFAHPATFYGGVNQAQACSLLYAYQATVKTIDGSVCSFTVDADNARFELDCDGVDHAGSGSWPRTVGAFHFDGDCDYVES